MNVICFGDSNTYGYDPCGYFGGRYSAENRWVDIFASQTGWNVRNLGMNGLEIPHIAAEFPEDTDLLIVMLGTNDLLQGADPVLVAERMEQFLNLVSVEKHRLLLIAPPPMQPGEWVPDPRLTDASVRLAESYRELAERLEICFADAGEWNVSLVFDGVHFSEAGHKAFAKALLAEVKNIFKQGF